jgi:hypothetical protein
MKRIFTLLTILIIFVVTASATLPPIRLAVTTSPAVTAPGTDEGILIIDVLSSDGGTDIATITIGHEVPTDAGGVISVVLNETTGSWTTLTYNKDDLVRVTYNGVVLSIDRMEVVLAKQGLFGVNIDAAEIEPSSNGNVLSTNSSGVTSWQPATEVLKTATMNWFFMPSVALDVANPTNGQLRSADLYAKFTEQFTNPMYKSADAPIGQGVYKTLPPASAFDYYITYYDNTVFNIQSLSNSGVLKYYVIGTPTEATYVNIIFVIK